jgi:chromosome segregation ATPase
LSPLRRVRKDYITERLGKEDIDQLINHHREEIDIAIRQSELKLNLVNRKIIEIEDKMKPEYRRILENKISTKKKEIESLVEPQKVTKPNQDAPKIKQIADAIEKYKSTLTTKESSYELLNETNKKQYIKLVDIEKLRRKVENFENAYKDLIRDLDSVKKQLMDGAISLSINFEVFDKSIAEIKSEIAKKDEEIQLLKSEISQVKTQILNFYVSYKNYTTFTLKLSIIADLLT